MLAAQPLAFLEPFIGRWGIDPESELARTNPERRDFVVFQIEWVDPAKKTLRFVEGVPGGDFERRILDNFVTSNPRSGKVVALGYQLEDDYLYESTFHPVEGGFVRDYTVTYPATEELRDEVDRQRGWIRYRDTCVLVGDDEMKCKTEQHRAGAWQPWGSPDGFALVRLAE